YLETAATGGTPFNVVDYVPPATITPGKPNDLFDNIDTVPVVLVVAADLANISMMDGDLARVAIAGGASIYPFCWNVLLSARAHGLGGVLTTFLSRAEPAAAPLLGLPEHHALAATIFLGVPAHQPTKLRRNPVESFTTVDRFDVPSPA
ncbi:MAG: nitroreductase family protein, partial [Ilumatobacteraceae bacterium]